MSKTSNMMNYMAEKAVICEENCRIDYKLYDEYGVKKGLRDKNGMGVLAGITNISHIQAYDTNENGEKVPCDGKLLYRGYNVNDLVRGFVEESVLDLKKPPIYCCLVSCQIRRSCRNLPKLWRSCAPYQPTLPVMSL